MATDNRSGENVEKIYVWKEAVLLITVSYKTFDGVMFFKYVISWLKNERIGSSSEPSFVDG